MARDGTPLTPDLATDRLDRGADLGPAVFADSPCDTQPP